MVTRARDSNLIVYKIVKHTDKYSLGAVKNLLVPHKLLCERSALSIGIMGFIGASVILTSGFEIALA